MISSVNTIVELLKMSRCDRIGLANAFRALRLKSNRSKGTTFSQTPYFTELHLRANHSDWIAFEQVFRYTCYGHLEKMGPIRTVIDAGANIGLSSVFFSKRLSSPTIIAIEPENANFLQAKKNTQNLPNIQLLKAALWHETGNVQIANPDTGNGLGFQMEESKVVEDSVPAMTVPDILKKMNWSQVDLLKIDIEGAEKEIFSSPSHIDWLHRVRIIAIELHDWLRPGCSLAFFRAIAQLDNIEVSLSGENLIIENKNVTPD